MKPEDKYDPIHCDNLFEACRLIKILHADLVIHAAGKHFWMWMFLANVFITAIAAPFFSGVIDGLMP